MEGLMSLISVQEFAGFKVKEWNIVQFSKLSTTISAIAKEYKQNNVSWDVFSGALSDKDKPDANFLDMSTGLLDLLEPFTRHAPLILQVSCGVDQKKLEELSYTDGIILLILVLKVNLEHLTSFFARLAGTTEATTVSS